MNIFADSFERWEELRRHRKVITVPDNVLRDVLEVPDSARVGRIDYDIARQSLRVEIYDSTFEAVPQGVEPPWIYAEVVPVLKEELTPDGESTVHCHLKIDWKRP